MSNPMITPIGTGASALAGASMPGRRPRMDQSKLMAPVADLLGMKPDELKQALAGGKTLNQLATDKGVSHGDLINAIKQGLQSARPTKAGKASGAVSDPDGDGDDDAGKMAEKIAAGQGPGGGRRAEGAGAPANSQMLDDVASMLKMSSTDLTSALTKGTSLADLAKQQDVSPDSLLSAVGRGMVLKTYA